MADKGINELKELASFVCHLGNGLGKALEDGKISLPDALHFSAAVLAAPKAFIGIQEVPAEYFDLSDSEKQDLTDHLVSQLDIPQDKVEAVIEGVLKLAVNFSSVLKVIMAK